MKAAKEYASRALWDEARDAWLEVLKSSDPKVQKDRIAATHNLGIYHEIHGELDHAEQLFESCFKQSGDKKYLDAKVRIKRRREQLKRLEQQKND